MGEVYRAWDSTLRRWVALKVVAKGDGSGRAERLLGEARAAAALHHTNIVSVFDVGEEDGWAYVSMDLVEGRPLRDYVADASIPFDKRLAWLLQIAAALRAAHKAGLVHRDIKPDNVMITVDGDVRVLDFGLAKSFTVDVQAPTAHDDGRGPEAFRTGEGRVIGTPAYMAPEQLAGAPPSPSWDQYAWGVLACELLTGKHPRVDGLIAVSGRLQRDALAAVPDGVAQVVARAMEPSPEQRFPSMEAIIVALGGPVSGAAPYVPAASNPPPGSSSMPSATMNVQIGDTMPVPVHPNAPVPQRSSRLGAWLGVAAVAALGASVAWWRLRPPPQPVAATPVTTTAPVAPPVASTAPPAPPTSAAPAVSAVPPAPPATPTAKPKVHAVPRRKLVVRLRGGTSLQYDAATVDRMTAGVKPLVQACIEKDPPNTIPAALGVGLELWTIGDEVGKVRDVRVNEPPRLSRCLRDVFMPLSMGPPKSPQMPPGAVFVTVEVYHQ
jgi:serine/threonine protein kinase